MPHGCAKGRCFQKFASLGPPTGFAIWEVLSISMLKKGCYVVATDPQMSADARSEESIVDNLLTFLFAGQDSTAAAMASCLCYLCSNPECKDNNMIHESCLGLEEYS